MDQPSKDNDAAKQIRQSMAATESVVQEVEKMYFSETEDDLSASASTTEYRTARSPDDTWRSTSISGIEDWWSVASNGTVAEDWKSVDEDVPEEWASVESLEDDNDGHGSQDKCEETQQMERVVKTQLEVRDDKESQQNVSCLDDVEKPAYLPSKLPVAGEITSGSTENPVNQVQKKVNLLSSSDTSVSMDTSGILSSATEVSTEISDSQLQTSKEKKEKVVKFSEPEDATSSGTFTRERAFGKLPCTSLEPIVPIGSDENVIEHAVPRFYPPKSAINLQPEKYSVVVSKIKEEEGAKSLINPKKSIPKLSKEAIHRIEAMETFSKKSIPAEKSRTTSVKEKVGLEPSGTLGTLAAKTPPFFTGTPLQQSTKIEEENKRDNLSSKKHPKVLVHQITRPGEPNKQPSLKAMDMKPPEAHDQGSAKATPRKDKVDIAKVIYSKESSESHTVTRITYEQQTSDHKTSSSTAFGSVPQPRMKSDISLQPLTEGNVTKEELKVMKKLEEQLNKSKEWIQLKIQEMHPAMTEIGTNLEEALELHQQHEKVLEKLQTKQSPVEELLRQADELISTQKPRGEVYSAMAENLGLAWKDLNAQLEQRRQILEQAVAFFGKIKEFGETLDKIQKNLSDAFMPETVELCRTMLQRHQEERKAALSCSMYALNENQQLLEKLCEVGTHSMGDSRPVHMQHAARQTSMFAERLMESLHDRWRYLETLWVQRKTNLDHCLKKCEFLEELNQLRNWLQCKAAEYSKQTNLGESLAGSEILLHEHMKLETESMEIRDQSLKLVKTSEQITVDGHPDAEELKSRAYGALSDCSDFLSVLESRHLLLSNSVTFFSLAQTALNKLDQIEIQLTTSDFSQRSTYTSRPSHFSSTIEEITAPAIHDGQSLMDAAGKHDPGVQGVARKILELENKRINVLNLCNSFQAQYDEKNSAFRNFHSKYKMFLTWIDDNVQAFLQRNCDIGPTQTSAKAFVDQHEKVLHDVRMKSIEIEALLSTLPSLIRAGGEDAQNVHQEAENLRQQLLQLRCILEKRIKLGHCYLAFHKLANKLTREIDDIEVLIKKSIADSSQVNIKMVEENLLSSQQEILQLKNSGKNFLEDASKVEDPYLNMKVAISTVLRILEQFEERKVSLSSQLRTWQSQISSTKEAMIQWEHLVKDSHRIIKVASELEAKMFPVIPRELNRVESIISFLENRMIFLLPQIKAVQEEMESFLKKSESLSPHQDVQQEGHKMIKSLKDMNQGFQKNLTNYQILISMMTSYFKHFEELEKLIDLQESQFRITTMPDNASKMEMLINEHDANKPTVLELLKFTNTEAEQLAKKINEAEPSQAASEDRMKITSIVDLRKQIYEKAWEEHKIRLERHLQLCIFNRDMQMINQQIEDLNSQLSAIKSNYGESLSTTLITSEAFIQFEKTIEILETRIYQFVSTAQMMMQDQKVESSHVQHEIQNMQNKWSTFRTQVSGNRRLIDLELEYFKVIEEYEEWFKEGSKMLITVARKSSNCKNVSEANALKKEVEGFINKVKIEQEERLKKISSLAVRLYGNPLHSTVQRVSNKNRDMLDSFTLISGELNTLTENIKLAEIAKVKENKEKEEIDSVLHAAQAEAEAAKAAAQAAVEAAKTAEAIAKAMPVVEERKLAVLSEAVPIPTSTAEITKPQIHIQSRAPTFIIPLKDAEVSEGTKFTFECKVEGTPMPEVQWFKDGILADSNPDYQTCCIDGVCTLTIEETFSEDTARFTCRATNTAGVEETQGLLTVKESQSPGALIPPHFVKELADASISEGASFYFECQVSGNPLPLVSWFKNDQCIDNSTDFSITYNNGLCTLQIDEAGPGSEGRYTCRASNQAGQVACSAELQILSLIPSEKPVFITPLSNVMARAGQKLRLECSVNGQPEPQVSWMHNGKSIKETRDIKLQFDGSKATLVITEAFPKDAGVYTIIAKNVTGEAVSQCNVSVKGRLPLETSDSEMASDIEPAKPQVKQHLENVTTKEGKKVRMDCVIVGQPEPEVIWYHNGKPVKESDDFQLLFEGDRCTLIIKVAYLEDAGMYKCVAINSGGEASSQCALTVETTTETEEKNVFSQKDIILTMEKSNPPKFVRLLSDIVCLEGQPFKLECEAVGEPNVTFNWYKDGKKLSKFEGYEIASSDAGISSLTIPSSLQMHQGTYSVSAQNNGGEAQSYCCVKISKSTVQTGTQTQVHESPPTFLKYIEDSYIQLNQPAKFESVVVGKPKPQVKWNFQGEDIKIEKGYEVHEDADRYWLFIPKVLKEHVGRYCVIAENNAGVSTSSALLFVQEPLAQPESWNSAFYEQKSQSMTLEKKMTMVQRSSLSSMTEVENSTQQMPSHLPRLEVIKKSHITHSVSEIPPSAPPKFIKPVSTAAVKEGEKLLLEGEVTGCPEPEIKWLKDGTELKNTPRINISCNAGKCFLFILSSLESDSGKYSCIATNPTGRASSLAEVRVKPHREAPKFIKRLQAGVVKSGAHVEMEVEVTGIPEPEIKWFRNNNVLQNSPDFRISTIKNKHSITINEAFPEDSGAFMAIASNVAGEARSIADLIVEEDKSPEEDKIITYKEISSVEQKKEFFTKISLTKTSDIQPYQISVPDEQAIVCDVTVKDHIPSPPPIPAVTAKVWTQVKPEIFPAPTVVELPESVPLNEIHPSYYDAVENFPPFISEKTSQISDLIPTSQSMQNIIPTTQSAQTVQPKAFIHTSVKILTESKAKPEKLIAKYEEKKIILPSLIDSQKPRSLELSQIQKFEPLVSIQSVQNVKQSSSFSASETSSVVTKSTSFVTPKQDELLFPRKFVSHATHVSDSEEDKPLVVPHVWKPGKENESESIKLWRPVNPILSSNQVLTSSYEAKADTKLIEEKKPLVAQTDLLSDSSTVRKFESSTFTQTRITSENVSVLKKLENSQMSHLTSKEILTKGAPKPIIKKDSQPDRLSDGPKPKKEVVIEEEPVVGAEVRPPLFSKALKDVTVSEKEKVSLVCEVQGIPIPSIRWFKDHKQITASADYQQSFIDGVCQLFIPEAYPEDSGKYSCTATNIAGCTTTSCHLEVEKLDEGMVIQPPSTARRPLNATPPTFEKPPTGGRFIEGGDAHFECRVRGNPTPEVVWSRRGMPIKNDNRRQVSYNAATGVCTFDIKGLTHEDDGEYTCTAVNCAGEASLTVSIQREFTGQMVAQDAIRSQQRQVQQGRQTTVMQHQQRVTGTYVQSHAQRQMDGIYQRTSSAEYEMDAGSPMYFSGTEGFRVDTFEYRLLREVEFRESLFLRLPGEEIKKEESVMDASQPPSAPQILGRPRNSKLLEGSEATFQAKIFGNPRPKIVWFKNGQRLIASQRFKMTYVDNVATLHIHMALPEDAGYYTLLAENNHGRIACSAHLVIEGVGSAPDARNVEYQRSDSQIASQRIVTPVIPTHTYSQNVQFATQAENQSRQQQFHSVTQHSSKTFSSVATQQQQFQSGDQWVASDSSKQLSSLANQQQIQNNGQLATADYQQRQAVSSFTSFPSEPSQTPRGIENDVDVGTTNRTLKPNFVKVPSDKEVNEGKMVRFDCRVSGRPFPDVSWYLNGRQVIDDATHKVLVNEGGVHALMITVTSRTDAGTYTCVAKNKSGDSRFDVNLIVIEKEQIVAPKFVERFQSLHVREGEPVTLHCRAVGTPAPAITWQKDGVQFHSKPPDTIIETKEGSSTLYFNRICMADSSWYQCTAQNQAGSTATRARLYVESELTPMPEPWRLNLPKPQKVIAPEGSPPREVVWLKPVERAAPKQRQQEEERPPQKPAFTTHIQDLVRFEGDRANFDARLIPIGDPTMIIEWYVNGKPVEASSRMMTTDRFGYVALTLLHVYPEDSGVYMCRAVNEAGEATTTATLNCSARAPVERQTQHPESIEAIRHLEDYEKYKRQESVDEFASLQKPIFIRALNHLENLQEGGFAHFEAQITPVSDPTMKVEWFFNGKTLTAGTRISTTFSFGYVALNISYIRSEDSGVYMCKATNQKGEAVSTATLKVRATEQVTGSLGIPEQERYIEKTQELEAYQMQQRHTYVEVDQTIQQKPFFKSQLLDKLDMQEGRTAHFEARLEPSGDSTMRVEWFKDGKPVEASSRITTFFNFGYVSLTIRGVDARDTGTYTCVATNCLGSSSTAAKLICISKKSVVLETQHPEGLEKIQHLEDYSRYQRDTREEVCFTVKPTFSEELSGKTQLIEGQSAHFETRLEPMGDPTMTVEWYFNGQPLTTGHRFRTYFDFGYVALDILYVFPEDTGTFTVVARNSITEARLSKQIHVQAKSAVDTSTIHEIEEKIEYLERPPHQEPQYNIEEISKSKPFFPITLHNPKPLKEGERVHLECRVEPVGDPTMKIEWFFNGKPLPSGSRFQTKYDFGLIVLDITTAYAEDTGEYTVRATNHLGSAHTSSCITVIGRSGVLSETQHPEGLEKIQHLEDSSRYKRDQFEETIITQVPTFTKPLHNIETIEGHNIHMECRLTPIGDPTMRIEWLVNGAPLKVGHRFRPAFEFDYVALDILSVYAEDSGVYTCVATSGLGQAVTSCTVKCLGRSQIISESQHPEGLQKIQYLEDASRYQRDTWVEESVKIQPRFLSKLHNLSLHEGQLAHFESRLEPINDSSLRVEWFRNGKPLPAGHRYQPFHDFGYVALNILSVVPEDSGTYTCRAVNVVGTAELQATLECQGKSSILSETQHPEGLQKIQHLEDYSRHTRDVYKEEFTTQAPVFTSAPHNVEINEGQRVHFECRLIPVGDPKLRVEWYHNGKPVKTGTRFVETLSFGFVALDIMYAYPEDSGTYTCKAINSLGEAVTSVTLKCYGKSGLILESQQPESLQKIQQLEDTSRYQRTYVEETTTQAPVFTQAMKNLQLVENQSAHFECRLIPVGDSKMKVEWFHNGLAIMPATRVTLTHDFGFVALDLSYVKPEDSGTYTCKATNELGQAVCSATLAVRGCSSLLLETQHPEGLQKIQYLEDSSRHQRQITEDVRVTSAPIFITPLSGPSKLVEGLSSHLECRIEPYPDPTMKIEWFFNGKLLPSGSRYRTMFDFGFAALDILSVNAEDSGEYSIKATNSLGTSMSTAKINVTAKSSLILESQQPESLQKIQMLEDSSRHRRTAEEEITFDKPNFGRPLYNLDNLVEGQSAHLEATLTPVNDPTMKVEWFYNGTPIKQGHRFKTTFDFGYVALDILYVFAEDTGTYMCKATNRKGEAITTCSIKVQAKGSIYTDTLHEEGLEKIRILEAHHIAKPEEVIAPVTRPIFLTPLKNQENIKEGQPVHLECKLEPINDPKLKVDWYVNGIEIKTGHRFKTIHDFGYVALDILYSFPEDSGTYMCKAVNELGEAVTTCSVKVEARKSIYYDTQHPEGLEKIRELECQTKYHLTEIEEKAPCKPYFITELRGATEYTEGNSAHFECRVEPSYDSELKIEFFHDGKPLDAGSRFHVTFDFGYVALDVSHVLPEDEGTYTVKATNKLGEATSSIKIRVHSKNSIISETQHPEGLAKIQALEDESRYKPIDYSEKRTFQRPVFTAPLQNLDMLAEGQSAHLECRLIPVGDPTLKVEWFFNERPLQLSSRLQTTHDFGYVALDIQYVRPDDTGIYMCRALNELGEAVTTASIKVQTKAFIELQSQHPEGLERIQELESSKYIPTGEEPEKMFEKPVFTMRLCGPSELTEGQPAHFETRVVPVGDPNLKIQWFVNGVELKSAARFHELHDFGMVSLDITSTIAEDSGVYMCKAINKVGEAVTSTSMTVRGRHGVLGDSQHPETYKQTQKFEFARTPDIPDTVKPARAPIFTQHLISYDKLIEGQYIHLEARVEPTNDEKLRIEWYKNGKSLVFGTRIRTTFDFGLVALDIVTVRPDDSGIYTCRAVNEVGEAITTCTMKVEDRESILYGSQHPESLPKIRELESMQPVAPDDREPMYESPIFISHLNNLELKEGAAAHFECRVEPIKDPKLQIEFTLNGKPLPAATRFTVTKDFGYVTLDISHVLSEDAGIYSCKATNNKGHAVTTGSLKVIGDKEKVVERTTHPMGQEGLSRVQEVEEEFMSRYQTRIEDKEIQFPKPVFVVPLQDQYEVNESHPLRLDCRVEPSSDPRLTIEWYFNGKSLSLGTRYQLTNDFGQVVLDVSDMWPRDSGVYTCRAYNAVGEAFTSTTIQCIAKGTIYEGTLHPEGEKGLESIQVLEESLMRPIDGTLPDEEGHPPVFTSHFRNLTNLTEGEVAHYEATLTPAGDQTMVVEWFFKGKTLKAGHRIRTVHAFGMVVLEILDVCIADSGEYICKATNKWGTAQVTFKLECVDRSRGQKPQFTTQLQSLIGLKEGESAHFECHLIPVGDPALRVEWFHNGQPMRHSSRIKTLSDFGYVVMDISFVHVEDSGEYVCVATNKFGSDTTRCTIQCTGHGKILWDSLQPQSLNKIAELEGSHAQYRSQLSVDAGANQAPKFTTQIRTVSNIVEGQSAHFEAYLTPTNDPNLKVEWYFNGKLLGAGHRFRTFHDFGIVILDILYCYGEDTGEYMCKATNRFGSDVTKTTLTCRSKSSIILEPQLPLEMAAGNERIMELEESLYRSRSAYIEEQHKEAPRFTVPLENISNLREGENAHMEARLIPTDDPDLKVEWFRNGKTLRAGTRIRTINDFGFVVLEISPVYPEDSGLYSCKATNKLGEAVTTCTIKCEGKRSVIKDTQLPEGMESMEKIARFEDLSSERISEQWMDVDSAMPPKFITKPQDLALPENSLAHFECRLTPVGDPTMKVEWYHNGKSLVTGSRVKTISDFGFVILEVAGVFSRDSGVYMCKAVNRHGEASVSAKLTVKVKQSVIMEPQLPSEWRSGTESLQKLEESMYRTEEVFVDDDKKQPPKFTTQIQNLDSKVEGDSAHFECRLIPVGDPTMKVEWFLNGKPLTTGTRVHTVDDFGFVVLEIDWIFPRDAGEYMCRATNRWGFDTTKAVLKIKSKRDIILDSQLPEGMSSDKLRELEYTPTQEQLPEELKPMPPRFTTQIQPQENLQEGDSAHFECRLEPVNDPKLKVEWYHNGKPLKSGHRFKSTHDFGFVALDVLYVYAEDSGEYLARAVNDYGEDVTKATLKIKAKPGLEYQTQLPKSMETGVQKIAEMEASWQRVVSQEEVPPERCRPMFVMKPEPQTVTEGDWAKFCCRVIGNPKPRIIWILNGNTVITGSRYKLTYDGIYHLDVPKSRQYDQGKVEVFARNAMGEAYCWTTLEVRPRHDDYRVVLKNSPRPWYDTEVKSYQKDRVETELEKVFEEKLTPGGTTVDVWHTKEADEGEHVKLKKHLSEEDTKKMIPDVKRYKTEAFYIDEKTGERRVEEQSQVQYMAKSFEAQAELDSQRIVFSSLPPQQESSIYGKEVHTSKQKQTQKEVKGDLEITRHTTVTETMEQEHKGVTKEKKVIGVVPETKPPMFIKKIEPCRVFEGGSGKFHCAFTGIPSPTITWYREHFPIKSSQDFQITTTDRASTLIIREVYVEDSGVFSVKAENRGGTAKSSANLVVEEKREQKRGTVPPSFTKTIQDCSSKVGQLVRLDANIVGSKPLDVYWLKNGKKIIQDITHKIIEEDDLHTLLMLEATIEDAGNYECVAINKVGEGRCQATVHIEAPPTREQASAPKKTDKNVKAPECMQPLKDTTVKESQPAVFQCKITGVPVPQVKWFRGDTLVKQSRYFRMSVENDVYTLRISEAFPEDEGLYKCVATNSAGTCSTSATLKVLVPEVTEVPPSISPLADLSVPEGAPARFVTTVAGIPTPKIIWYREGNVVKPTRDFQMFQDGGSCSLVIRQTYPEDEGVYTCRATNASGQAETSAKLTVESKP